MMNQTILCFIIILFILSRLDLTTAAVLSITKDSSSSIEIGLNQTDDSQNKRWIDMIGCDFDDEAINHGNTVSSNIRCSYEQRSKTTAVLISIYFGIFGVDWFYLSRGNSLYIIVGLLKLFISFSCCICWPLLTIGAHRVSKLMLMFGYIGGISFSLICLFWWIIDWARILANKFPDGHGVELKHFSEYF